MANRWMYDAIVRNLEVIGEAANRFPKEIQSAYPDIPWHQIVGMRNRIVHEYADIDLVLVIEIMRNDLPVLKRQLKSVLSDLNQG